MQVCVRGYASIANLGPGFDILALALSNPYDDVLVRLSPTGPDRVRFIGEYGRYLPSNFSETTIYPVVEEFRRIVGKPFSVDVVVKKGIKPASGLGSSGADAAAVAYALDKLLSVNLTEMELVRIAAMGERVAAGSPHMAKYTAAYGLDLPAKVRLPDLLSMILDKVPGDYRIRVGMMTPNEAMEIIDELLDVYKDERVFKFFHIPVQSGDDRVLKIMNRRYTVDEFIELHANVKKTFPDSLFATDIIVGHPGEDEEAFMRSVELVKRLRFERVYLAQYSIRPRTLSASMPQVPEPVKKERSLRILSVIQEVETEIYKAYIGRELKALVTSRGFRDGYYVARAENYFPISIREDPDIMGRWIRVKVTDATYFDLRGYVASPL